MLTQLSHIVKDKILHQCQMESDEVLISVHTSAIVMYLNIFLSETAIAINLLILCDLLHIIL